MDAYIHNTEKIFVNAFIQKLNDHAEMMGDNQLLKRDYQDSFTFQKLNEYLQVTIMLNFSIDLKNKY